MAASATIGTHPHDHVFLGAGHERNERRTWFVIILCGAMMLLEIVGGLAFGSIALVADGLHMSTHAGALLLAALAYTFSRRHAKDPRFTFGTGKFGDLAGFTSAIVLAMIALLIGYESVTRLLAPVPIHFSEAISIAMLDLCVNVASAWLPSGDHDHGHSRSHGGHYDHADDEAGARQLSVGDVAVTLSIHEDGGPSRFRLVAAGGGSLASDVSVQTIRPDGARQRFSFADRGG
ncbi:MAG: CDF family Co(II)/Ni(II) efflux transporter DmeF, partial [Sphingomonas sp.]